MKASCGRALLGLALCACSGGTATPVPPEPTGGVQATEPGATGDDAGPPAEPGDGGPGSVATAGCGLASVRTGIQSKTMKVAGESRRYQLLVPAGYDANRPTRLVFVFHGLGGDGDQIRDYFGFEAEAGGQALFVYPDGLVRWQGATAWAESDLAFFDAMVSEISASTCVDTKRIFATGHSFGGYMSNLVGCERGDVVRAIAPVSGGLVGGACKRPVAVWLAHGNKDSTVPESEGLAARDRWLEANGCATTKKPTMPSPCVSYDGCSANHPVTWCSFPGGHYPLPKFTKAAIWDFFERM